MNDHIWHILTCSLALLALLVLPAFGFSAPAALALFLILMAGCMVLMTRMAQRSNKPHSQAEPSERPEGKNRARFPKT